MLVEQSKNLGDRQHPVYARIRVPYMTVDGRIKIAMEEHKRLDKKLHITSEILDDPVTEQKLVRATVRSEVYGSATGTARIFLGGTGANETNPEENAETSAVGRALGFLGYGCFGTGVASADEVMRARRTPGRRADSGAARASHSGSPADSEHTIPAPHRHVSDRSGAPPRAAICAAPPRSPSDDSGPPSGTDPDGRFEATSSISRGDLLRQGNELGVSTREYILFLIDQYRVDHPGDRSDENLARKADRFGVRQQNPASAGRFREYCLSLIDQPAPAETADL